MRFCTRCGSRFDGWQFCGICSAIANKAAGSLAAAELPPSGDLPSSNFTCRFSLLGRFERERSETVPFSYINGMLLGATTHEDKVPSVHLKIWSQNDDLPLALGNPIVAREFQPSITNILRLKLGSRAVRSIFLSQVRLLAKNGNRLRLIFPPTIECASSSIRDCAAIALVHYAVNDFTWSTIHPDIYAPRSRLSCALCRIKRKRKDERPMHCHKCDRSHTPSGLGNPFIRGATQHSDVWRAGQCTNETVVVAVGKLEATNTS